MVVYQAYSHPIHYKYKTTLCSKSSLFFAVNTIFTFILPLIFTYRSHGFWLKYDTYREQPEVKFKYQYVFQLESDDTESIMCASFPANGGNNRGCSSFTISELDVDRDGRCDRILLRMKVKNISDNFNIRSIMLILVFDYKLYDECILEMETAAILNHKYYGGSSASKLRVISELHTDQKTPLYPCKYGRHLTYNRSIIEPSQSNFNDDAMANIFSNYAERNISTYLVNRYEKWSVGKAANEAFEMTAEIYLTPSFIVYKTEFWQIIKQAWIQYFSIFAVFFAISRKIKKFVFENGIVPTVKTVNIKA